MTEAPLTVPLQTVSRSDVALVGGKNASLGEMIRNLREAGVRVPPGFASTVPAYQRFLRENGLQGLIQETLSDWRAQNLNLAQAGLKIRTAVLESHWPRKLADEIRKSYRDLCIQVGEPDTAVAVRSSATAEDLPDASFAGQQETFLNVRGENALLAACRRCYASLYTDRAISYRQAHDIDQIRVGLSIGVQHMVRADVGSSGVMFSIDPETGFDKAVVINAAWGLGETVVQGVVDPDEYVVFKPLLQDTRLKPIIERKIGGKTLKMLYANEQDRTTRTVPTSLVERERCVLNDDDILQLGRWACAIEKHYGMPMDMEWARDGRSGELYIVQARPETVKSRQSDTGLRAYRLQKAGPRLLQGSAIGEAIVSGPVCLIQDPRDLAHFPQGAVLVAENTDPDWVPLMRKAAAIVTDHGGRTSHAAIVSRELGLPAVIGCGQATRLLHDQQQVTISCAEGDIGAVYDGPAEFTAESIDLAHIPATRTRVMLNMANPAAAFRWWRLPAEGIGLARMEFVISNVVRQHPMAAAHPERVTDPEVASGILRVSRNYADPAQYFVETLALALARIAAVCHPRTAIQRLSDFKSNEYAGLPGGRDFEPVEEKPMLGLRGASRYYSPRYADGFALECQAVRRLREVLGFRNVAVMIPFCRTPEEADRVLEIMSGHGLRRGQDGLQVYVMCEIPANVILTEEFAQRFDGFSIGSNDLTQLTLGIDRDSDELAPLFSERNPAVTELIADVIHRAHAMGIPVGLCGEAPSNDPSFAVFLAQHEIDSISVNPASFMAVKANVHKAENAIDISTGSR